MPACDVLTFETPEGHAPATAYVESLTGRARQRAAALLKLLAARGRDLRLPHSRALGSGLFELRDVPTGVRIFYAFLPADRAVLLDGMTKKRDDIPPVMMARLRALHRAATMAR